MVFGNLKNAVHGAKSTTCLIIIQTVKHSCGSNMTRGCFSTLRQFLWNGHREAVEIFNLKIFDAQTKCSCSLMGKSRDRSGKTRTVYKASGTLIKENVICISRSWTTPCMF